MLTATFFFIGLLLLLGQTTLLQMLPSWLGRPDLIFLLVVFIACRFDMARGAILVLLLGLVLDIFSGVFLGLYPVINLLAFSFIKGITRQVAVSRFAYQVPLAALSYLLLGGGIFIFLTLQSPDNPPRWAWQVLLTQFVLMTLVAAPFFQACNMVMAYFSPRPSKRQLFRKRTGNRFND